MPDSATSRFYAESDAYADWLLSDEGFYGKAGRFLGPAVARLPRRARALEIGCGLGTLARMLARRAPQVTILATDIAESAVARCKQSPNPDNLHFDLLDWEKVGNGWDMVYCFNVIEHVDDPAEFVRTLVGAAKIGGLIGVLAPNLCSPVHPLLWALRYQGMGFEVPRWRQALQVPASGMRLARVAASQGYGIRLRTPNLAFPTGDNDATWYANPISLRRMLRTEGCRPVAGGPRPRSQILGPAAPSAYLLYKRVR